MEVHFISFHFISFHFILFYFNTGNLYIDSVFLLELSDLLYVPLLFYSCFDFTFVKSKTPICALLTLSI